jgi:hypothetical protein
MSFAPPLPPSHAKTSRRWIYVVSRRHSHVPHLPRMQERAGGAFFLLSTLFAPPPLLHAKQAGGHFDTVRASSTSLACRSKSDVDFYRFLMLFAPPPPPSPAGSMPFVLPPPPPLCARMSRRWIILHFHNVPASSTFLACKSGPSGLLIIFWHHPYVFHLTRVQPRAGGGGSSFHS